MVDKMTKSQVGHEIYQTGEMQSKVFVRNLCDSPSYLLQGTTFGNSWHKFYQFIFSPSDT
jgi:hypothetical protein